MRSEQLVTLKAKELAGGLSTTTANDLTDRHLAVIVADPLGHGPLEHSLEALLPRLPKVRAGSNQPTLRTSETPPQSSKLANTGPTRLHLEDGTEAIR